MSHQRGRLVAIGLSAAVALSLVASVLLVDAQASPEPEPRRTGKVKLTVLTPAGVPATAMLRKKRRAIAVAKPADGRSASATFKVAPGVWKPTAEPVLFEDRYYVPTASTDRVRVVAGRTTVVTVRWKYVATARQLRITSMTSSSLALGFVKPKKARVAVRYRAGNTAPESVRAGRRAAVSGATVRVSGLAAGTAYSFALFTKVRKRWLGPIPLTATTRPAAGAGGIVASYVADPATVLVPPNTPLGSRQVAGGRVVTRLPARVVPVVGRPVVLPASTALPGGFVGTVVSVSADGSEVTLDQAPLGEAFDYVKVQVPDLAAVATAVPATARSWARSLPPSCSLSGGASVQVQPSFNFHGSYIGFELASKDYWGISVVKGLRVDAKLVANFSASISATVSGSYSCSQSLIKIVMQFAAGPIPMLLTFKPKLTISAGGKGTVSGAGVSLALGFQGSVDKPLLGAADVSFDPIAEAHVVPPGASGETAATVFVGVQVGGQLDLGPGLGNGGLDAGVQAGISGSLDPLDTKIEATSDGTNWCLEMSASGSGEVALFAAAWIKGLEARYSWPVLQGSIDYGGPWQVPDPCPTEQPRWVGTVKTDESYASATESRSQKTTYSLAPEGDSSFSSVYEDARQLEVPPCGTMHHAYSGTGSGDYPGLELMTIPDGGGGFIGQLFGVDDGYEHDGSGFDDSCVPNPDGPGYVTRRDPYTGTVVVYPPGHLAGCLVTFPVAKGTTHITGTVTSDCSSGGQTVTSSWTYDLMLQPCNLLIDTDDGGLADCVEKAYGLDPTSPADD